MRDSARTEILPRFASRDFSTWPKERLGDLVTEADVEAERRITADLRAVWPDALIVGEEAAHEDASLTTQLPPPISPSSSTP
ncbi:MAG: inositol monophosphatase family protein [Novosphingobium sp.]|nr:inositol monophosphatase family protein [Novosphingobium sp.]